MDSPRKHTHCSCILSITTAIAMYPNGRCIYVQHLDNYCKFVNIVKKVAISVFVKTQRQVTNFTFELQINKIIMGVYLHVCLP